MSTKSLSEVQQIEAREALLDREILDRQKLKEAYRLVREDLARGPSSNGAAEVEGEDLPFAVHTVGPQLEKAYGQNTKLVRWAISKMSADYTIRDLREKLLAHGHIIGMNPIATVLNRLKKAGEIRERVPGSGRRPAIFRC